MATIPQTPHVPRGPRIRMCIYAFLASRTVQLSAEVLRGIQLYSRYIAKYCALRSLTLLYKRPLFGSFFGTEAGTDLRISPEAGSPDSFLGRNAHVINFNNPQPKMTKLPIAHEKPTNRAIGQGGLKDSMNAIRNLCPTIVHRMKAARTHQPEHLSIHMKTDSIAATSRGLDSSHVHTCKPIHSMI